MSTEKHHIQGLNQQQVEESRRKHGINILTPPPKESLWKQFFESLKDPLIKILFVALGLSVGIAIYECSMPSHGAEVFLEPAGILIAILMATVIGFVLEVNANKKFDILNQVNDGAGCDFYGGSLKGIVEKLDYLKELGINVLYLNPIFEARSSHRYDTADYLNVDPILGGTPAFMSLENACRERGIKIILDGVFSHTGADSKYFNKFDRYEGVGAYKAFNEGEESRYRSWYNFFRNPDGSVGYDSWWGFPDLPNINEDDLSYRNFIFGKDGVVDVWTSRGASGFRLDVSDELPDSFIRQMRQTVKEKTGGEGAVIGEVWEDASNKCSYGSYRDFMLGNTHDAVMGYTFRHILLDFLCGYIDADIANSRFEGFR